jgi:hypothetical protein
MCESSELLRRLCLRVKAVFPWLATISGGSFTRSLVDVQAAERALNVSASRH